MIRDIGIPTCIAICLVQLCVYVAPHEHHPVPTYFWRRHENDSLVDRSSPDYNEHLKDHPVLRKIPRGVTVEPIKLHAWPGHAVQNGGKVRVLWSGITNPQPKDWIGFYCPFYDAYGHQLDYFYINKVPGHEKDAEGGHLGYGHVEHNVYNMRKPCQFRFYRQVFKNPEKTSWYYVLGATSNKVTFANGGEFAPEHGHLSLTNDPTQMRVMWVSGQVEQPPVVRYGTTKALELSEYAHTIHTYTKNDLCEGVANANSFWHPGITYDVLLSNLKPKTTYYYAYGTQDYMSATATFTTALPSGDTTPFKFNVFGDMGIQPYPQGTTTAQLLLKEVLDTKVSYIHHIGDISYARGYAYIWDQWGPFIEPYTTLIPYMVGIGNHEYDHSAGGIGRDRSGIKTDGGWKPEWFNGKKDSGGECGVPTFHRYHMPDNGNSLFWYSYDYGLVHMIMMSTEHDYSLNSTQYKWLENDLRSVNRTQTPWVVLGGHRPMYNSNAYAGDYNVAVHMQELFEDLLYKYKVDIAFWGHYHSYERTCALYKSKCVKDGVIHVTVGNAGFAKDHDLWYDKEWSLVRIVDYGFGRVTVANASAMLFEVVINRHDDVRDHVWLYK